MRETHSERHIISERANVQTVQCRRSTVHAGEIENGVPKPWVDTDQSGRAALALTSMQGERVKADIRVLSTLHKVISGDRQMVFLGSVIIVAHDDNLDTVLPPPLLPPPLG